MSEHRLAYECDGFKVTATLTTTTDEAATAAWSDSVLWSRITAAVMNAIREPVAIVTCDPEEWTKKRWGWRA